MSDLIDRQAAIDSLDVGAELLRRVLDDTDIVGVEREKYEWGLGLIESCILDMKELPSAQPEIIRCKDCKHFELSKDELASQYKISGCFRLKNLSAEYPLLTDGNGFCSWAERRTE